MPKIKSTTPEAIFAELKRLAPSIVFSVHWIAEGGGIPDWRTADGDYGCDNSPDTSEDGTGGHMPRKLQ